MPTRKRKIGELSKAALPTVAELAEARRALAEAEAPQDLNSKLASMPQGYGSYALSLEMGQLFDKLSPGEGKATCFRADSHNWEQACDRAGVERTIWTNAEPQAKRDMIRLSTLMALDHVYYAMALLKIAQRRAIEVFLESMQSENAWLRLQAAQSVAQLGGLKAASVIEVEQRVSGKVEVVFRAPGGQAPALDVGQVATVEPVALPAAVLEEAASAV